MGFVNQHGAENRIIEFVRSFPARGPSISDTDSELAKRFRAVGDLKEVIDYMAKHGKATDIPNLGVLNTAFRVRTVGRRDLEPSIDVVPMGADNNVLLGCFDLTPLHHRNYRPEQGDVIDLFGVAGRIGESVVGYAVLDRYRISAAGFGFMKYAGRLAIFAETPSDESLESFAGDHLHYPEDLDLRLARPDKLVQPAAAFVEANT